MKNSRPRLDKLVEQVKRDRSILAAILCGSLSHDKVWEKSDIDLILVSNITWTSSRRQTTSLTSAPKAATPAAQIVVAGTPEQVAACKACHTGAIS